MKLNIVIGATVVLFILFMTSVTAQNLLLSVEKDVYHPLDTVRVTVTVKNNYQTNVSWSIECGFISGDPLLPPMLLLRPVELEAQETKTVNFSMNVLETMPSGAYEARVRVLDNSQTLNTESKYFKVSGTKKIIDAYLRSCWDPNCDIMKTVFIIGDTAYIKIFSDTPSVSVSGVLNTPSESRELVFSDMVAVIPLSVVGDYSVSVTLSKSGYEMLGRIIHFAVIEKEAEVRLASVCNVNQVCEDNENYQNCPQDCASGSSDGYCDCVTDGRCDPDCAVYEDSDCVKNYLPYLALLLTLLVILVLYARKRGGKRGEVSVEMVRWVEDGMSKGFTPAQLKKMLINRNRDPSIIDKVLESKKKN